MLIFAIDPGPVQSGWVLYYSDGRIAEAGIESNEELVSMLRFFMAPEVFAIETMQASYAATVGASVIDTLRWVGRFQQAWHSPDEVRLITRQAVKAHVCNGNTRATDAGVRQALIDKLGPPGTKKAPGPTYGVTSHAWAALAVAVTAAEVAA